MEIERTKQDRRAVGEVNDVGPSDVFARIGTSTRVNQDLWAVIDDAVILGILVPFRPPTGVGVGLGAVIGVPAKEMYVIPPGGGSILASMDSLTLFEIDGDEVPASTKDACWVISDEEQFIGGLENGVV